MKNRRLQTLDRRSGNLQRTLLTAFLVLSFIPIIILGLVLRKQVADRTTELVVAQLDSVATLKEQEVKTFLEERRQDLGQVLTTSESKDNALYLLQHSPQTKGYRIAEGNTYGLFRSVQRQAVDFTELFLVNREGIVVLSTEPQHAGVVETNQAFYTEGLKDKYVSPLLVDPESGKSFLYLAEPVQDYSVGITRGVLVARLKTSTLDKVMLEQAGLGETGETYLVSQQGQLITPLRNQTSLSPDLDTYGIQESLAGRDGFDQYHNYAGTEVIGYYRWLPYAGAGLLAEQARSEAFAALDRLTRFAVSALVLVAIITTLVILAITRRISQPIVQLTESATRMADGDLDFSIDVHRRDEIGTLAQAFNSMTAQLRDLIGTLEQRVADRTTELERRSIQLQAAAETGSAAASMRDLNELLTKITHLISDRFGYYHTGIFLLGEKGEYAVLRATNSEGGQRMLDRGHKLKVGEVGIVGYVTANRESRIALDVGHDAVFFDNPDLPDTRSEMALPLIVGGELLGALDVQSKHEAAFSEEDISVLQMLADQVAVAIDNARLFAENQAALEASRRAYGELSQEAWGQFLRGQPDLGFLSTAEVDVTPAGGNWTPEMHQAAQTGSTVRTDGNTLTIPILLRDQVLGVVRLCKPEDAGPWTNDEVELMDTLIAQLEVALESARLYQDTQRRAAREQMVTQITTKIRATTDPQVMLQTAVSELREALGAKRAQVVIQPEGRG
ncbi:MAG: GAF domain-containing protein [Chloroflexi bacterium]|nr:GAF domain-containing protein [Chloroflexota bacterium]MBU1662555.1 GAF domain-containing protein [Chloroflexota bacterium]